MTSTAVPTSGAALRRISGQTQRRTPIAWLRARTVAGTRRRHLVEQRRRAAEPVTDTYLDRWPALPHETSISIVRAMGLR